MAWLNETRYTPRQLMQMWDVSRTTLWRWGQEDYAPRRIVLVPKRIGGRLYYTEGQLQDWQRRIDQRIERLRGDARRKRLRLRRAAS